MSEPINERHSESVAADVKSSLAVYFACLAGLWAIGLLAVEIQSRVFHRNYYPFNTLLFRPTHRFTDFTTFYPKLSVFGDPQAFFSPNGVMYTYPAPLLIFNVGLFRLSQQPLALYIVGMLIFAALVGVVAFRLIPKGKGTNALAALAALAAGAFSFPLYFLLDRGNLEGIVWIACIVGLYFFVKRRYYFAATLFALAASMKIFPAVLLLLFLAKRRYKEFFVSAALIVTFTLIALWITGPSIIEAAQGLAKGVAEQKKLEGLMFLTREIGFDHCLFSFVKWISLLSTPDLQSFANLIRRALPIYAVSVVVGFLAIYFARLRRMPVLNQIIALVALSIMLPYTSFEYTLVHLIGPFVLLLMFLTTDVATGAVRLEKRQLLALLVPFALLFAPMSFFILLVAGFGGQIKAVALICLVRVCLRVPLPSSLFGELGEDSRSAKVLAEIEQSGASGAAIRV
jgi:Glycosyltransferase family 87